MKKDVRKQYGDSFKRLLICHKVLKREPMCEMVKRSVEGLQEMIEKYHGVKVKNFKVSPRFYGKKVFMCFEVSDKNHVGVVHTEFAVDLPKSSTSELIEIIRKMMRCKTDHTEEYFTVIYIKEEK